MEILEYLEKKKTIQKKLIEFLDETKYNEEELQNIFNLLHNQKIHSDIHEFNEFIHLLLTISDYHHRTPNFFEKIEKIFLHFRLELQERYSNQEIFNIFKINKRILLFLIKAQIIQIDSYIINFFSSNKMIWFEGYLNYLFKELKSYITDENILKEIEKENSEYINNFDENCQIGENDSYICQLIRADSIEEFIIFVNKNCISLNSEIPHSIFETNSFLIAQNMYYKKTTLIKYSAFFGSNQIFKYLYLNGVPLDKSIIYYAIHGENAEIIHLIEENNKDLLKDYDFIFDCYQFSIQCHHIDISNYFYINYIQDQKLDWEKIGFMKQMQKKNTIPNFNIVQSLFDIESLNNYNYSFFPNNLDDPFIFYHLCMLNYVNIVKILLQTKNIKINYIIILNFLF